MAVKKSLSMAAYLAKTLVHDEIAERASTVDTGTKRRKIRQIKRLRNHLRLSGLEKVCYTLRTLS